MSYLPYYEAITYLPIDRFLETHKTDLLIVVDAPSIQRVTNVSEKVLSLTKQIQVAIFDHHKVEDTNVALLENQERYAAVEVIYSYVLKHNLILPDKWEEYYLTGFIGDSYRFYYQYPSYRETFEAISVILDHGYTIREYSDRLYGYSKKDLLVFKLLLQNLSYESTHALTYISWEEFNQDIHNKLTASEYKKARRYFIDEMMVKTYEVDYAVFIVPDDTFNDNKTYSGSIRAKNNTIDCTVIAKHLNGGGHTTGSGFVIVADTIEEALKITQTALASYEAEARISKS